MQNIGIFGGTFNPIHIGHLIAAQEVLSSINIDKILFIPSGNPPHKMQSDIVSARDRYNMIKLSISDNGKFELSDMEIKREGKTYTYDTLMQLHNTYYGDKFHFIMGFDTLKDMDTWRMVSEIHKLADIIVVNRGNLKLEMEEEIRSKRIKYNLAVSVVNIPDIGVSSTMIRDRISKGYSLKYLLKDEVIEYINSKELYRSES